MPKKVLVFILSLAFILLVGFLMRSPQQEISDLPCGDAAHSHDGGPLHCD